MAETSDRGRNHTKIRQLHASAIAKPPLHASTPPPSDSKAKYVGMRLIPWSDIWTTVQLAKIRGDIDMLHVFYNALFNEAIFDDRGAWSMVGRKLS